MQGSAVLSPMWIRISAAITAAALCRGLHDQLISAQLSNQPVSLQAAASWSVLTSSKPVPGGGSSLNVALCACCDSNQARAEPLPRELFWGQALQVRPAKVSIPLHLGLV